MSTFEKIGEMLESEHADFVDMSESIATDLATGVDIQEHFNGFINTLITHPRYAMEFMDDINQTLHVFFGKCSTLRSPDLLKPTFGEEGDFDDDSPSYELRGELIDMFARKYPVALQGTDVASIDWGNVDALSKYDVEDELSSLDLRMRCIKYESLFLKAKTH